VSGDRERVVRTSDANVHHAARIGQTHAIVESLECASDARVGRLADDPWKWLGQSQDPRNVAPSGTPGNGGRSAGQQPPDGAELLFRRLADPSRKVDLEAGQGTEHREQIRSAPANSREMCLDGPDIAAADRAGQGIGKAEALHVFCDASQERSEHARGLPNAPASASKRAPAAAIAAEPLATNPPAA
jgi:hypothetical protein